MFVNYRELFKNQNKEGSKMHIKTSLVLLSLLIFVGCESSMTKSDATFDDKLIQEIIGAEKIESV